MPKKSRFSAKDLVKYLRRANQLERKILGLYYLENIGVADISAVLNKDRQYVSAILGKALENLTAKISKSTARPNKGSRPC